MFNRKSLTVSMMVVALAATGCQATATGTVAPGAGTTPGATTPGGSTATQPGTTQPQQANRPPQAGESVISGKVTPEGLSASALRVLQQAAGSNGNGNAGGTGNGTQGNGNAFGKARATGSKGGIFEVSLGLDLSFSITVPQGDTFNLEAEYSDGQGGVQKCVKPNVAVPIKQDPETINLQSLVTRRTGAINGLVELVNAKTGDEAIGADVYLAGGTSIVGKAGTRGQFTLAGVAEGSYNVVVDKPGYKRVIKKLAVKSGQTVDFGTAKLERVVETFGGLKGKVVDASGAAVVGASVSVFPKDRAAIAGATGGLENFGAVTNENGEYELLNLPAAAYSVQVYRPFYLIPARRDVTVAKDIVTMEPWSLAANILSFGQIAGRVVDEKGDGVEGALVQTYPQVTDQQFADADGNYVLDRVLPGEYDVNASAGGLGTATTHIRLENAPGGAKLALTDLILGAVNTQLIKVDPKAPAQKVSINFSASVSGSVSNN